jgi:hypothetical protein
VCLCVSCLLGSSEVRRCWVGGLLQMRAQSPLRHAIEMMIYMNCEIVGRNDGGRTGRAGSKARYMNSNVMVETFSLLCWAVVQVNNVRHISLPLVDAPVARQR